VGFPKTSIGRNALVAGLPASVQHTVVRASEPVQLVKGMRLFADGDAVPYVYFPTDALVSIVGTSADGAMVDLLSVDHQGVVGVSALLSVIPEPYDAVVRLPGQALRCSTAAIRAELPRQAVLRDALATYAARAARELAQAVVCRSFHRVRQRLARWLLVTVERRQDDTLAMTHEDLSHVLGVARPLITRSALELHDAGGIRYRYGRVVIVDRHVLERASCECYRLTR
jgi:CRP-like cAMP-binding protein